MDLTSPQVIKQLLARHGARASKRLGQHFLIDKNILKDIIEAAELNSNDIVLEIGPGIGTLTQELAKRAKRVVAVEKDRNMIEMLKELLDRSNVKNVQIVESDILKLKSYQLPATSYKLVANLPYYLTSPVLRLFLERLEDGPLTTPKMMVLMVQKEVAQRICPARLASTASRGEAGAKPPRMSLLAVSVQFYAQPEIVRYVSRTCFWPQPKVDSALIKVVPRPALGINSQLIPMFFRIVRAGFSQPRKQLINNLSTGLKTGREQVNAWLLRNNIRPSQRAETLSVEDWLKLAKSFKPRSEISTFP